MTLIEQQQLNQMRLARQGSYTQETGQWITHELYDTLLFPATPIPLEFFQVPMGGAKGFAQTNMKQAGQLPVNQEFRFHAVEFSLFTEIGAVAADRDTQIQNALDVIRYSWHQFVIDGREYDLQFAGSSLLPAIVDTGSATTGVGRLTSRGEYRLGAKINIGKLTSFVHRVGFDPLVDTELAALNADGVRLQIRLVGELSRKIA